MSTTTITLRFDVDDGEVKGATVNLENVERQAKKTSDSINGLSARFRSFTNVAKIAAAAAVATAAAITAVTTKAINYADAIDKASKVGGIAADQYQTLTFALDKMGISQEQVNQMLGDYNGRLGQAAAGNKTILSTYQRLGINIRDASGEMRDSGVVLREMIAALGQIENPAERAAAAAILVGEEAGRRLAGSLSEGAQAIFDLEQKALDLGLVLSNETVQGAVQAKDELSTLAQIIRTQVYSGLLEVTPEITNMIREFTSDPEKMARFREDLAQITGLIGSIVTQSFKAAAAIANLFQKAKLESKAEDLRVATKNLNLAREATPGLTLDATAGFHLSEEEYAERLKEATAEVAKARDAWTELVRPRALPGTTSSNEITVNVPTVNLTGGGTTGSSSNSGSSSSSRTRVKTEEETAKEIERINARLRADQNAADIRSINDRTARIRAQVEETVRLRRESVGKDVAETSNFIAWETSVRRQASNEIAQIEASAAERADAEATRLSERKAAQALRDAEKARALAERNSAEAQRLFEQEESIKQRLINETTALEINAMDEGVARIRAKAEETIRLKRQELDGAMALTAEFAAWETRVKKDVVDEVAEYKKRKAEENADFEKALLDKITEGANQPRQEEIEFLQYKEAAYGGIADTVVAGALDGQAAFKDMASSVLRDLAAMIIRAQIMKALTAAFGGTTTSANGNVVPQLNPNANPLNDGGVVHSKGIHSSGTSTFAEQGSEAIMPLKRTNSGKLGVMVAGGGGGGGSSQVVNITNNINTNSDTPSEIADATSKQLKRDVESIVDNRIQKHQRAGGSFGR